MSTKEKYGRYMVFVYSTDNGDPLGCVDYHSDDEASAIDYAENKIHDFEYADVFDRTEGVVLLSVESKIDY